MWFGLSNGRLREGKCSPSATASARAWTNTTSPCPARAATTRSSRKRWPPFARRQSAAYPLQVVDRGTGTMMLSGAVVPASSTGRRDRHQGQRGRLFPRHRQLLKSRPRRQASGQLPVQLLDRNGLRLQYRSAEGRPATRQLPRDRGRPPTTCSSRLRSKRRLEVPGRLDDRSPGSGHGAVLGDLHDIPVAYRRRTPL